MITNWKDRINFGKFKGKTVRQVFEYDATYLYWAMMNTNRFNFEKEVKDDIQKRTEEIDAEKYEDLSWGDFHT
jgi:hypothetical protein